MQIVITKKNLNIDVENGVQGNLDRQEGLSHHTMNQPIILQVLLEG